MRDGVVAFASNHAGGILGGISTGQPIVARFAVKPTSSILTPRHDGRPHGQRRRDQHQGPPRSVRRHPRRAGGRGDAGLRAGRPPAAPPRAEPGCAHRRRGCHATERREFHPGRSRLTRRTRPAMQPQPPPYDPHTLDAFVAFAGARRWAARMAEHRPARRRRARVPGRRSGSAMRWNWRSSGCAARSPARRPALNCTLRGWPATRWCCRGRSVRRGRRSAARTAADGAVRRRHAGAGVPPAAHGGAAGASVASALPSPDWRMRPRMTC